MKFTDAEKWLFDSMVARYVRNRPFTRPGHGSCCTCQRCGWPHDECECDYTENDSVAVETLREFQQSGWGGSVEFDGHTLGKTWVCNIGANHEGDNEEFAVAVHLAALKAVGHPYPESPAESEVMP